jgi:RNA polymerase sigma-70 factor (ECF subfamily)
MPVTPTHSLPGVTPDELADAFVAQRPRLRAIATRTLGSVWDADDVVQETWLRLQRTDASTIDNLEAWLTTVVSRACVDHLRRRGARPDAWADELPDETGAAEDLTTEGPEQTALRAEDVGLALDAVLDALGPLERLSFVLHDVFGLSFDDVAPVVERSPAAARQLASRARRKVRGADPEGDRSRRTEAVDVFLRAAREGDFGGLLQLLDPDVELRADDAVIASAAPHAGEGAPLLASSITGADAVARVFAGRAAGASVALVDGIPGAAYAPDGVARGVYAVRVEGGRITRIEVFAAPQVLADLDVVLG